MDEWIVTRVYESPCGALVLGSYGERLCLCDWLGSAHHPQALQRLSRMLMTEVQEGDSQIIEIATMQLDRYFAGELQRVDVPLQLVGTPFQTMVWKELLKVPFGQTVSYGDIAQDIGLPKAVRAVANAVGANAMSIIIPCHRIIGHNGALTGYAGGLHAKEYLLKLEKSRIVK